MQVGTRQIFVIVFDVLHKFQTKRRSEGQRNFVRCGLVVLAWRGGLSLNGALKATSEPESSKCSVQKVRRKLRDPTSVSHVAA